MKKIEETLAQKEHEAQLCAEAAKKGRQLLSEWPLQEISLMDRLYSFLRNNNEDWAAGLFLLKDSLDSLLLLLTDPLVAKRFEELFPGEGDDLYTPRRKAAKFVQELSNIFSEISNSEFNKVELKTYELEEFPDGYFINGTSALQDFGDRLEIARLEQSLRRKRRA